MGAFKAYDIRGVYNKDFNKDDVYKIGYYLVEHFNTSKILVGYDVRESSPEIFDSLCKGITDNGCDVYDMGFASTPMVYYATAKLGYELSVQITASHNSKEYNGLKISGENAMPIGYDTGLKEIEDCLMKTPVIKAKKGKVYSEDIKEEYIKFLHSYIEDYDKLNISVDCSNGMACLLVKDVLGDKPFYIFDDMDGTFPNHEPNPLEEENLVAIKKLVVEKQSDIGVIFDGDADRVMFIDEKGRFISPDLIIALMSEYFLEKEKGNVLQDIRTSKSVTEYIESKGCNMHIWRVGRAFAAVKLKEINGIYGGELAGHYYFRDFYYSDSAMLACIIVLNVINKLKREGVKLSEYIDKIHHYSNSGEINFRIERKDEAIKTLCDYFTSQDKVVKTMDFDGYRIEFSDWWFNVRQSNTEPYLRFIAEAINAQLLEEKVNIAKEILNKFQ